MKKLIEKLKKIKSNSGSGIILVIVALGFIGILSGALLTAVNYVYKLKLYDYNARDNFYYVEQAMNEIYSGIGNETVKCMQDAYQYTVDNMTHYDLSLGKDGAYTTVSDEEANAYFKKQFIANVYDEFYGSNSDMATFVMKLDNCISNKTVQLRDYDRTVDAEGRVSFTKKAGAAGITVILFDKDGNILTGATSMDKINTDKIVIKNIVLSRTAEYNRSTANGEFTQTLSSDIVISRPDFDVEFNSITTDFSSILDYTIIADMGIDINQATVPLSINGNLYAAADFYNKAYNFPKTSMKTAYQYDTNYTYSSTGSATPDYTTPVSTMAPDAASLDTYNSVDKVVDENGHVTKETIKYVLSPVTSKVISFDSYDEVKADDMVATGAGGNTYKYTYYNTYVYKQTPSVISARYDGLNEHSKYSGLYINGADVNIISDMVVVPGSIAVMNGGKLGMFGASSNTVVQSEVWADNFILGGYSLGTAGSTTKVGAKAVVSGNLYVKDDLELDADGASFKLNGSYYGYGDSTKRDNRKFIPLVNPSSYYEAKYKVDQNGAYILDANGNKILDEYYSDTRGHYNSSAIVINGQESLLDLSGADALFIAGRSYIELSKSTTTQAARVRGNDVEVKTYAYDASINDYRMGDSISLKPNQVAYMPVSYEGAPVLVDYKVDLQGNAVKVGNDNVKFTINNNEEHKYYLATLPEKLQHYDTLFGYYFGTEYGKTNKLPIKVPCIRAEVSGKEYYYYDFKAAYQLALDNKATFSDSVLNDTTKNIKSADDMAKWFFVDYADALKNSPSISPYMKALNDDSDDTTFKAGDVLLPDTSSATQTSVYSSGAITSKDGTVFKVSVAEDVKSNVLDSMLGTEAARSSSAEVKTSIDAMNLSHDLERKYNYVKFALQNVSFGSATATLVDSIVGYNYSNIAGTSSVYDTANPQDYILKDSSEDSTTLRGESAITPINTYFNFNRITASTDIKKKLGSDSLAYVCYGDVTLSAADGDGTGNLSGIIITKGDVKFADDVKSFTGMIVAGGKLIIADTNTLTNISASAEVCRAILNELQLSAGDSEAKYILKIMKNYEDAIVADTVDDSDKVIERLDYSSVLKYENWVKDVN